MSKEITIREIQDKIITLPNRPPAMLARDLAEIYETKTERINEAVRRNPDRFPEDFCFRLTKAEAEVLTSQNAVFKQKQAFTHLPWMFTRNGSNQLSSVLKTPAAAQRSVQIMRAFSTLEEVAQKGPDAIFEKFFGPSFRENWKTAQPADPVVGVPASMLLDIIRTQQAQIKDMASNATVTRAPNSRRAQRDSALPYFKAPFTKEEKELILSMYTAGVGPTEIGRRFGRSEGSISSFISSQRKAVN